jgi:hypothetical protein
LLSRLQTTLPPALQACFSDYNCSSSISAKFWTFLDRALQACFLGFKM